MKKFLVIMLAGIMAVTMCACGEKEEVSIANPVHECSKQEMLEVTGMDIDAPAGATDVEYGYIENGENPIAEVEFEINDIDYYYRAQSTAETSLGGDMMAAIEAGSTLAGLNYEFKAGALVDAPQGREGVYAYNEDQAGFIAWLDVVPGVMYALAVEEDASVAALLDFSETLFVPMQGEVG